MNIQELATIQRYSLPIKILVIDNKYLGMVRQWQQLFWDRRYSEVDLYDNPDFVKIGRGLRHPRRPDEPRRRHGAPVEGISGRPARPSWWWNARRRPTFIPWFPPAQRSRR